MANADGVGPQVLSPPACVQACCPILRPLIAMDLLHLANNKTFLQPALGGASTPAADKAKPAAVNITATPTIPASSDKPRAPAQSSNTRARRLSYVTNDVSASYCSFFVYELFASVQPMTF